MLFSPLVAVALAALPAINAYPVTSDSLNCRSGPGTTHNVTKTYTKNQDVSVTCQIRGTDVQGNNIWDKTSDGCYVADFYLQTNSTSFVTDKCEDENENSGNSTVNANVAAAKGKGHDIVAAARTQKGKPYVWGGGGCKGPSGGGYDCSGLTQYALCKALNKKIPRVAQDQYDATKQGKRIPRSQAKEGDLLFWGTNGNCKSGVVHVGIFINKNKMINAAKTGTPVREQDIWTSYGGEKICDHVMRYDGSWSSLGDEKC